MLDLVAPKPLSGRFVVRIAPGGMLRSRLRRRWLAELEAGLPKTRIAPRLR